MRTLRITQTKERRGRYRVEVALDGNGLPRQMAAAHFDFELSAQEQEDLRWSGRQTRHNVHQTTP